MILYFFVFITTNAFPALDRLFASYDLNITDVNGNASFNLLEDLF